MAQVIIPASRLADAHRSASDEWYELQQPASQSEGVSGEIRLAIELTDVVDRYELSRAADLPDVDVPVELARALADRRAGKHHTKVDGAKAEIAKSPVGACARLRVGVLGARGVLGRDDARGGSSPKSDVFADAWLEASYWRTSTAKQTCDPEWSDAPQEVPVTSDSSRLHVILFDYDYLKKNDYLGEVLIGVSGLLDGAAHDGWVKLGAPADSDVDVTGEVHLRLQLLDVDLLANERPRIALSSGSATYRASSALSMSNREDFSFGRFFGEF